MNLVARLLLLTLLLVLLGPAHALAVTADPDPVGVWPLRPEPAVLAGFDPPRTPFGPGHRGVDLLGRPGQPVLAALPGRISFAGRIAGRGVVVVDHGATRTTYEPVRAAVGLDVRVRDGDLLGTLEAGAGHCLPRTCLHWGWIEGVRTYLDPLRLVGLGPVRLLPLWGDLPDAEGWAVPAQARGWAWR